MKDDMYDLIVIGAGMAGVNAANKCGAAGWRVAIVDELPYGGTCALRGCDPKKILRRAAEIIDAAHLMEGRGVHVGDLAIDWAGLMDHKHGFTDSVPENMEEGLHGNDVETLHGTATFTSADTIEVDGRPLTSEWFLVATGATPRSLPFQGAEHLIDSTDFLHLDALPGRVLFVGGGFVSMEFAHIAARAGAEVVVVDRGQRPLKGFDPDLVDVLVDRSRQIGIDVRTGPSVQSVEASGSGFVVELGDDSRTDRVEADVVVHGAGRVPALDRLGLDAAGVTHDERGIRVHPHLQSTSNPRVWAAGDAAAPPGLPLPPVAVFEGKVAASNMLKGTQTVPDYDGVATGVFTIPELTRVGTSEADARDRLGDRLRVRHTDTSGWYSSYRVGETHSAAKVLIDTDSDTIVGAHLLGPEYGEITAVFALAISQRLTTRQLKSMDPVYPTVASDIGSML